MKVLKGTRLGRATTKTTAKLYGLAFGRFAIGLVVTK